MLFYMIGIKGAAMSSLAKILCQMGHIVKGVDVAEEFYTSKDLQGIGLENFSNMKLKKFYYYIIGNAFVSHSVTNYIKNMKYFYQDYPSFLNWIFKQKEWVCISGSHGKTTTTKMVSTLLKDSTSLIGDGSFSVGNGKQFVIESCEYRNTFLNYKPYISLILNVDYDHIDFFKTKEDYESSFKKFAQQSQICIVNGDEFSYRGKNVITYGKESKNDVVFHYEKGKVTILRKEFMLPVPGEKFAYDFVGAYLIAKLYNLSDDKIQALMNSFVLPKRRHEKSIFENQIVLSDYGHHPNEIRATYDALKEEYPDKTLICVFEPHTITRLQCFVEDFKNALQLFDECYMYALFSSVREAHNLVLEKQLYKTLGFPLYEYAVQKSLADRKNIVLCFMGAGTIDQAYEAYIKQFHIKN